MDGCYSILRIDGTLERGAVLKSGGNGTDIVRYEVVNSTSTGVATTSVAMVIAVESRLPIVADLLAHADISSSREIIMNRIAFFNISPVFGCVIEEL